jgi:AhpD family alkylhydroperoxidase
MKARIKNPAMLLPQAVTHALIGLGQAMHDGPVSPRTTELVHLRVSQLNGCAFCVDMGVKSAKKAGESDERLHAVAAWRESPLFDDAEKAALALAEAAARITDRGEVPDDVWNEAARHYDEKQLAQLIFAIGLTVMYNTFNVTSRQVPGSVKFDQ